MKLKQILIAAFAITLAAGTVSFAQDQSNGGGNPGPPAAADNEGPPPGEAAQPRLSGPAQPQLNESGQVPSYDNGQPPADDSGQPPPDQSGAPQGGHGHHGGHRARMMQVESDLEANPKLVEDPNYLAAHPGLQRMLQRHPEMAQKIEQDPQAFFQQFNSRHAGRGNSDTGASNSAN
jgi:hypothetical protein